MCLRASTRTRSTRTPDWSSSFARGGEIWGYFRRVADRYGLRPHIRFNEEIVHSQWEDGHWRLRTAAGEETTADVLVSACGVLHHPRTPDIEGLDTFAGAAFHSARWDHAVPLDGRGSGWWGQGPPGVQITADLAYRAASR